MSQQINLLQARFRKQRRSFSARHLPHALILVLAGCGVVYGYAVLKTRELEALARQASAAVAAQRQQVVELGKGFPTQGPSKVLESEVERLEAERRRRQQLLGALSTGELGNTTGFSEVLAALGRRNLPGVWLVGVSIADAGRVLEVQGRALGAEMVPAYLGSLGAESMMQRRRVTELKLAARSQPPQNGAPAKPRAPERFVEFAFSAPLAGAEPAPRPPATGGK